MASKKTSSKGKTASTNSKAGVEPQVSLQGVLPGDYTEVLGEIKEQIGRSQTKAAISVNQELIGLYFHIGEVLSARIASAQWGDKIIKRLSLDLRAAFPGSSGFSRSNLFFMCQFYKVWSQYDMSVQQAARQVPWWHHVVIITKVSDPDARPLASSKKE